ncbi:MAG: hypothetical protein N2645_09340 [Clostridia bacterium]|nr:hypothetical protein [Clostridia bacterium]
MKIFLRILFEIVITFMLVDFIFMSHNGVVSFFLSLTVSLVIEFIINKMKKRKDAESFTRINSSQIKNIINERKGGLL